GSPAGVVEHPGRQEKPRRVVRADRTANRHWWAGGRSPEVNGRPLAKELGNLPPYLRKKGGPRVGGPAGPSGCGPGEPKRAAVHGPERLFNKNTGLCERGSGR